MTRVIWMTFFGEYRGEGHPHESPKVMTVPAAGSWPALAVVVGFLNLPAAAGPGRPRAALRALRRADLRLPRDRAPRVQLPARRPLDPAGRASASSWPGSTSPRPGPPRPDRAQRRWPRAGYAFLENKYYLDALYEGVIVDGIKGPIARGRLLVQPARPRRRRQRRRHGRPRHGNWLYKLHRPGRRRPHRQRLGRRSRGLRPAPAPHPDRPGAAVRRPALRRRGGPRRHLHRHHLGVTTEPCTTSSTTGA